MLDIDGTGYFKVEPYDFYHKGIVVMAPPGWVHIDIKGDAEEKSRNVLAMTLGYIPYDNIVDYDMDGDEFYYYPHLFCDFVNVHDPFEKNGYALKTDDGFLVLRDDDIVM